jgi:hypothetical protein
LHKIDPALPIFAASEEPTRIEYLLSLGITQSYIKTEPSLLRVYEGVLQSLGYDSVKAQQAITRARESLSQLRSFATISVPESGSLEAVAS